MFNITGLISPLLGLKLVRASIEKELKFRVPVYELVYISDEKNISFHIPVADKIRVYPYQDSAKLCKLIDTLVAKEVKTNDTIKVVKIKHEKDTAEVNIYYINSQGEKLHKKELLK